MLSGIRFQIEGEDALKAHAPKAVETDGGSSRYWLL